MLFGVNTIPDYRKRGLAGRLITQAINDVQIQGRKGLVLTPDFNADFAKIDGAIAACSHTVKGAYTGNGSYLTVELGFRHAAVLVSLGYQSYNQPRLSIDGDTAYMVMTDSGFRVQDDRNANLNEVGREYLHLAFQ